MKNAKEILSTISQNWFLTEPLLFDVLCSHKLTENQSLLSMFRTGQGRIEYNPFLVEQNQKSVETLLTTEIYRILLKHPYERAPLEPNRIALKKASDITVREHCHNCDETLISARYYNLKEEQSYEEYYKSLKDICPDTQEGGALSDQNLADYESSDLWEENSEMSDRIQDQVEKAARTNQWGSVGGDLIEKILASKTIHMDYKHILAQFRTSVRSNSRTLTRLRPNRRYGFDYMGSRYKDTFKLLVAVDSSASILNRDLENFFSIINRFFKYGAKEIKVIVFDTQITQEMDLKKAEKSLEVKGRGGTDFQAAIDYYEKSDTYDGMIIFTDGYAQKPRIIRKKRILWIMTDQWSYKENKDWIKKINGSSITWIKEAG